MLKSNLILLYENRLLFITLKGKIYQKAPPIGGAFGEVSESLRKNVSNICHPILGKI